MNFLSLDQNFTEIYPDNAISGSWKPTVKTLKLTSKQFDFHWCNDQAAVSDEISKFVRLCYTSHVHRSVEQPVTINY